MGTWKMIVKMTVLAVVIFLNMGLMGCQSKDTELSDKFDEETVKSEAMKSIELFNKKDYDGIIEMGIEEFKEKLSAEDFAKQCDPILDKRGEFKEIQKTVIVGSKDKESGAEYAVIVLVAAYEEGKIQFTIGFDEDMKLIQFFVK